MKSKLFLIAFASLLNACATLSVPTDFLTGVGAAAAPPNAPHKLGSLPTNGGGGVVAGSAGQVFVTNSGPAAVFTSLIKYETTHGRFTSGGSGSDYSAVIGPCVGGETTLGCIYVLPNGTAASANNFAVETDGTNTYLNTIGASAGIFLGQNNSLTLGAFKTSNFFLGGTTTSAPVEIDYTTTTTPVIESGTNGVSLTVQTNKAGGVLNFGANAATNYMSLGGATGQGLILAAASPTIATSGASTLSAAQAADPLIKLGTVSLSANATVVFPNAQGFWIVDASGITLNGHTLQFVSGSTTAAAITPSTTNQLFFVSTYGANTISVK